MIEIREARYSDIPKLIPLMKECFKESDFAETFGFTSKEDDTMQWFAGIVNKPEYGFFVALDDEKPVGFLVVGVRPWVMNFNDTYAFEMFYYVEKGHRNGRISRKLVKFYEEWAKSIGCKAVEFGVTEKMKGEKMAKFLIRLGFVPALRSHVKRLEVDHGIG